jgi:hypothetical protein
MGRQSHHISEVRAKQEDGVFCVSCDFSVLEQSNLPKTIAIAWILHHLESSGFGFVQFSRA